MDELKQKRYEKNGYISNEILLKETLQDIEEFESLVLVAKYKDKQYGVIWSETNSTEAIGMLEVGKLQIYDGGKG